MDLDPKIFDAPIRSDLLYTVNVAQLAARRSGTAAVKNRALVSGGGIKPLGKGSERVWNGRKSGVLVWALVVWAKPVLPPNSTVGR